MKLALGILACAVALAVPAGAAAVQCAPPGNSGVNQYAETIPGASCNGPPSHHHHGSGGSGGGAGHIPSGTSRALSGQGGAGHAVQALVANTGTAGTAANGGAAAQAGGAGATHGSSSGSGNGGVTPGASGAAGAGSAAAGAHAVAPSVNGRGLLSALLHPIVTGASHAGGTGVWLPIFFVMAFLLTLAGLLLRRSRLHAARRRWTT